MRRLTRQVAAIGIAAVFIWAAPAQAQFFVDCGAGGSIQDALDAQDWAPSADVEFVGTCEETVAVRHPRASIVGIDGATLVGRIRIFGPSNVVLRDFTVTGDGAGLSAFGGRTRVGNVIFSGNRGPGVAGNDGATIRLNDCWITANLEGNGISLSSSTARLNNTRVLANAEMGIAATDNSTVIAIDSSIGGNLRGIYATGGSSVNLDSTAVVDQLIDGLLIVGNSSAVVTEADISRNGGQGLEVDMASSAEVQGGSITDNGENGLVVGNHSFARVTGTEILGNTEFGVLLINDSGAILGDYAVVPENAGGWAVGCNGKEAGLEVSDLATVGRKKCPDPKF